MKSIMATYSGFQALPRGVKRLLLTSESFFFMDAPAAKAGGPDLIKRSPWMPANSSGFGGEQQKAGSAAWNNNTHFS